MIRIYIGPKCPEAIYGQPYEVTGQLITYSPGLDGRPIENIFEFECDKKKHSYSDKKNFVRPDFFSLGMTPDNRYSSIHARILDPDDDGIDKAQPAPEIPRISLIELAKRMLGR